VPKKATSRSQDPPKPPIILEPVGDDDVEELKNILASILARVAREEAKARQEALSSKAPNK
jgi:hypothetical protein